MWQRAYTDNGLDLDVFGLLRDSDDVLDLVLSADKDSLNACNLKDVSSAHQEGLHSIPWRLGSQRIIESNNNTVGVVAAVLGEDPLVASAGVDANETALEDEGAPQSIHVRHQRPSDRYRRSQERGSFPSVQSRELWSSRWFRCNYGP